MAFSQATLDVAARLKGHISQYTDLDNERDHSMGSRPREAGKLVDRGVSNLCSYRVHTCLQNWPLWDQQPPSAVAVKDFQVHQAFACCRGVRPVLLSLRLQKYLTHTFSKQDQQIPMAVNVQRKAPQ